jgi:hypothetical protein
MASAVRYAELLQVPPGSSETFLHRRNTFFRTNTWASDMPDNSHRSQGASKRFVTTKEAAERLHISPSFLAKARVTGQGPAYVKIGRAVRYSVEELEKFGLSRTKRSTSQY